MKQAVITRIHGAKSLENALAGSLKEFLLSVDAYADLILVCIGSDSLESLSDFETKFKQYIGSSEIDPTKVKVLPIYPWGRFVTALNVALRRVLDEVHYRRVIFQSLEFLVDKNVISTLSDYMTNHENAIVVGPAMNGHLFVPGSNPLTGRTCPWNTCAMWDLEKLHLLGFPMIGDGLLDKGSETGGVEVSSIARSMNTTLASSRPCYRRCPPSRSYKIYGHIGRLTCYPSHQNSLLGMFTLPILLGPYTMKRKWKARTADHKPIWIYCSCKELSSIQSSLMIRNKCNDKGICYIQHCLLLHRHLHLLVLLILFHIPGTQRGILSSVRVHDIPFVISRCRMRDILISRFIHGLLFVLYHFFCTRLVVPGCPTLLDNLTDG